MLCNELSYMADWYVERGKPMDALPYAKEAVSICRDLKIRDYTFLATSVTRLCSVHLAMGGKVNYDKAVQLALDCITDMQDAGDLKGEAVCNMWLSEAYIKKQNNREAQRTMEKGLSLGRDCGDKQHFGFLLHSASRVKYNKSEFDKALEYEEEAQAVYKDIGANQEKSQVMYDMIRSLCMEKKYEKALEVANKLQDLCNRADDKSKEANACLESAQILGFMGSTDDAKSKAEEAVELAVDGDDARAEGLAFSVLVQLHMGKKEYPDALRVAKRMHRVNTECGDKTIIIKGLQLLTDVHIACDEPLDAARAAFEGLMLARDQDLKKLEVEMLLTLSSAYQKSCEMAPSQDDFERKRLGVKAMKPARDALALARKIKDQYLQGSALFTVAQCHYQLGRPTEGLKSCVEAKKVCIELDQHQSKATCTILMAKFHHQNGNTEKALELLSEAIELCQEIGDAEQENTANEIKRKMKGGTEPEVRKDVFEPEARFESAQDAAYSATVQTSSVQLDPAAVARLVSNTVRSVVVDFEEAGGSLDSPLMESGMDSLSSLSFRNMLVRDSGMNLPSALMFDYPTQRTIVDHILSIGKTNPPPPGSPLVTIR
eukprot:gnl/TRDRNA2_/TRDRNA2_164397_c1_seq1.p1 gnl/TRDRNA2_/TRDRNA2_164397_c1~~gnl/TRDRNA2_/TRDRNA2_164397_c1_seq1.p1  ORF type:complete len:602 (+),score=143.74 gnl/TRDRNA2_/TRDRNA2_164397_c1_seq1:3-1808(+)